MPATVPPSAAAARHGQRGSRSIARASATMSASPAAMIASACSGSVMRPTVIVATPVARRISRAKGHVNAGSRSGDFLGGRDAACRNIDPVAAARFQLRANSIESSSDHPPGTQSVAEKRTPSGAIRLPGAAHRVEHFEREADAVRKVASVRVDAPVRDRRQEFVQQITVRHVQLDRIDAAALGACARW
jgi:hypothetical protein